VSISCFVFLFSIIINVGVSRCENLWWSCGRWRCYYL